ncbi:MULTISPECIES: 5-methyltetrahydropteroyltriglutamate--homocysteine S-methyltransferase [unclassified Sporosarcina]|uniref:5-methyltetrahydropteroyltriglutamate-- homocysteine S-methyltransferase n=1 Tax=unclassified Sporosarcina TaxID=2647733 RepID=UPI000C16D305|nr:MULTISPECIES: 5-methyltetrahydropteroyltriglutamate--homocysteine S-methyltransferase [unclassified Sporosarcina]PID05505.1 5-methyltetrahydropteroyltriglutamate--homocysteine methyltransferase [Sporosarcina sp. P30]PID08654.1 5-methyltetrahydropteroyltriglutamate--homocysteine methyltransferase [Sporosarcina sp. P31]PID11656.1 5-methyltetrahydropteroyltriglutamate--homocysteine methyltransferase [Sporosarcina sp. P32b]
MIHIGKHDHVGSFLRTDAIKDARKAYINDELTAEDLRQVEDVEIEKLVKKQIDLGIKAITDGEFRRSWFMHDFFWGLGGVSFEAVEKGYDFVGQTTRAESFKVTDKISFGNHEMVNDLKFLADLVEKYGDGSQFAKYTIPAPTMFFQRVLSEKEKEIYPNIEDLAADIIKVYQDAIQAFYDAGCRYLQFDECILSALDDPKLANIMENFTGLKLTDTTDLFVRVIKESLKNKPEDMIVATHMCKGNYKSAYLYTSGYETVSKYFDELGYDVYLLEYDDERSGGFEPLANIKNEDTQVVLGVVTSKTPELEDANAMKEKVKAASEHFPLERLLISPQCGFASTEEGNSLSEEEQWDKMEHIIKLSKEIW